MANPTTNFGWVMPTSSSLVTNLPADFNTFGQAVDTSMSELLGGTTGQVLSKTSNTNMDFTWVTTDDANAIQNSIVDAKGDLIGATANDTPSRLAVGTNEAYLKADSTAATGLKWDYDSWTAYTPTIAPVSGSFTTASASGRYKQIGKTCIVVVRGTITTVGTGSGLTLTVPFTSANQGAIYTGGGRNDTDGNSALCRIISNDNKMYISLYNNANPAVSGNAFYMNIVFEIA
jgi:hypothetical protein